MESRLLEYFVAVAAEQSVTRAARRLYAAQSTVSAGVRSLERELGVHLFDRTTKSVRLTHAGEELLDQALHVLDGVERLRVLAGQSARGQRGRLRLGTFTAQDLMHDLPSVLREFRLSHPHVDLRLADSLEGSTGFAEDLRRGRLDVAFFALPAPPDLDTVELVQAPYVVFLPPAHPLADRRSVSLARLAREDWVDGPPGYGSRVQLERALAARGLSRRVVAEIAGVPGIPAYVAGGIGVAVLPDIVDPAGCAVLQLVDTVPPWTLSLAMRREAAGQPLVAALVEVLRAHAARAGAGRVRAAPSPPAPSAPAPAVPGSAPPGPPGGRPGAGH